MKRRSLGLIVMGVVTLAAIGGVWADDHRAVVKGIYGERGIQIISHADRVEIYRLKGRAERMATTDPTTMPMIEDFPIELRGPGISADLAKRMATVLLDEKTYRGPITNCGFDPHFALRFVRGKEAVNVLMCFHCYIIAAWVRDGEGKLVQRSGGVFDGSGGELKKLMDEGLKRK